MHRFPVLGESSDEELVKFIDKYITTRMPEPVSEPNLYQAVQKHQIHTCTDSCLTQYKKKTTRLVKCRYGHPFDIQLQTEIQRNNVDEDPRAKHKNYLIRRLYNALRVNPYNPAILLGWDGNMDIQFVAEVSLNTIRYVTGYMAKGETKALADNALAGAECITKSDLIKLAMLLLRQREMGMPKVYARLMGLHLYNASFLVKFLNTNEKDKRVRMMKSKAEIAKLAEDEKITQNNIIDDYYPNRPAEMENRCLYNVFAALEYSKRKPKKGAKDYEDRILDECDDDDNNDEVEENVVPQNQTSEDPTPLSLFPRSSILTVRKNLGYFKAKTKLKIVRFFLNDLNGDEDETDDYCRHCLLLFKPWRDEEKDLKGEFKTFQDAFQDFMAKCGEPARKEILKLLHGKQNMLDAMKENMSRAEKRKKLLEQQDTGVPDVTHLPVRNVTEETLHEQVIMLNEQQKEAFDTISKCVDEENPQNKHFFISGVAGTGKSHLIKTLADYITLKKGKYKTSISPPVLLSAPTGKASLNIQGNTIHSLLGLPVEKGRTPSYHSLKPKKLPRSERYSTTARS